MKPFKQYLNESQELILEFVPMPTPPAHWRNLFFNTPETHDIEIEFPEIVDPIKKDEDGYSQKYKVEMIISSKIKVGDNYFFYSSRYKDSGPLAYEVEFSVNSKYSITNLTPKIGIKILNMILQALYWFMKIRKPNVVTFSAYNMRRQKLYVKMIEQYIKFLPEYTFEYDDIPEEPEDGTGETDEFKLKEIRFTLTRKESAEKMVMNEAKNIDSAIEILRNSISNSEWDNRLYIAGGAVRDELLGREVKDIDFVVDGGPDAGMEAATFIAKKLNVYKPESNPVLFPTYGTAKLTIPVNGENIDIEFVAPRKERYEPGSRKPSVSAGTLQDDANRRDFTVNSLFKNLTTGKILDLTGRGIKDLNAKVLNTTGDADWIFSEDPLRILRAVRFALKYNFTLPLNVIRAIKRAAPTLKNISAERISDELSKILVLSTPSKAIRLFKMTGITNEILPELNDLINLKQNAFHTKDAFGHTLDVLDNAPPELIRRLAALFHDLGKAASRTETNGKVQFIGHAPLSAELAQRILRRLKYPNEVIDKVAKIAELHMDLKSAGKEAEALKDSTLRKFVYKVADSEILDSLLDVIHADNISHTPEASMPKQIERIREKLSKMDVQDILNTKSILDGNDIMKLGAKGKLIGEIKNRILIKVLENPDFTKEQAINLAQNMIKSREK